MKKSVMSTLVLVCICAVMAILLAITNMITAPTIQANADKAANEALLQVMPEGKGFEKMDISSYKLPATVNEVYKESNGGYVVRMTTTGYGSGMVIMCGVSADGTVTGAVCLGSSETLGYEKTFGENFTGKDAAGVDAVDTISSATKTTAAYKNAVKDALNTAIILNGGSADLRDPAQIFNDNLSAALPAAEGKFTKLFIADSDYNLDFIYAADNGAGYVYVIEDRFIGMDAACNVTVEGVSAEDATQAQSRAALALSQTTLDITGTGINENVTRVQKTADGHYLVNVNGLGFAYFGDDSMYQPGKNIPIEICVVLSSDGKILKCLTVSQEESGGYGAVCGDEAYYSQFNGKTESDYKNVDAISGATITTKGYMKAIERAFECVKILEGGSANEE